MKMLANTFLYFGHSFWHNLLCNGQLGNFFCLLANLSVLLTNFVIMGCMQTRPPFDKQGDRFVNKCFIHLFISLILVSKISPINDGISNSIHSEKKTSLVLNMTFFVRSRCEGFTHSSFVVLHAVLEGKTENYISQTRVLAFFG